MNTRNNLKLQIIKQENNKKIKISFDKWRNYKYTIVTSTITPQNVSNNHFINSIKTYLLNKVGSIENYNSLDNTKYKETDVSIENEKHYQHMDCCNQDDMVFSKDKKITSNYDNSNTYIYEETSEDEGETSKDDGDTSEDDGDTSEDDDDTSEDEGDTSEDEGDTSEDDGKNIEDEENTSDDEENTSDDEKDTSEDEMETSRYEKDIGEDEKDEEEETIYQVKQKTKTLDYIIPMGIGVLTLFVTYLNCQSKYYKDDDY